MAVIFVNSLPVSFLNAATGVATHNNIIKQLHCRYQLHSLGTSPWAFVPYQFYAIYIPSFTTVPISGTQSNRDV